MKASLIFSILCALESVYCLYAGATGQLEDSVTAAIVFAVAAVLLWLKYRKSRKKKAPAKAPAKKHAAKKPAAPAAAPVRVDAPVRVKVSTKIEAQDQVEAPVSVKAKAKKAPKTYILVYDSKVKGTAAEPERQEALAWLKEQEEEGDDLSFSLEEDEYDGSPCIKVMAAPMFSEEPARQIGFIAAEDVDRVLPYVHMDDAYVYGKIYGGRNDKYYGAAVKIAIEREITA